MVWNRTSLYFAKLCSVPTYKISRFLENGRPWQHIPFSNVNMPARLWKRRIELDALALWLIEVECRATGRRHVRQPVWVIYRKLAGEMAAGQRRTTIAMRYHLC